MFFFLKATNFIAYHFLSVWPLASLLLLFFLTTNYLGNNYYFINTYIPLITTEFQNFFSGFAVNLICGITSLTIWTRSRRYKTMHSPVHEIICCAVRDKCGSWNNSRFVIYIRACFRVWKYWWAIFLFIRDNTMWIQSKIHKRA